MCSGVLPAADVPACEVATASAGGTAMPCCEPSARVSTSREQQQQQQQQDVDLLAAVDALLPEWNLTLPAADSQEDLPDMPDPGSLSSHLPPVCVPSGACLFFRIWARGLCFHSTRVRDRPQAVLPPEQLDSEKAAKAQ